MDRALSLAIADEHEASLRWAAALVRHDPAMPTALCLCGRLLGALGRPEVGREACGVAIERAIDLERLPLAVVATRELGRLGGDPEPYLDRIAASFCKGSPRLGTGAPPAPPPLPAAEAFQPLPSVLTGALLLNKATEIVRDAKRRLARGLPAEPPSVASAASRPGVAALPLFSTLGQGALRALCAAFAPRWVPEGAVLIAQGTPGGEVYVVARGELSVRRGRDDEAIVLARLTNGALFGEVALLSRAPRAGSVVAARPSIVLELKREALEALSDVHPEVAAELAARCRERMIESLVRMSDVLRVLPDADRPALVARLAMRTFEKGERLLSQDERPTGLFLIASGEVAVVRREAGGDPLVLGVLGPGEVAGEVEAVLRRPASADVIATRPTVALHLATGDFLAVALEHPAVLAQLYQLAVRRDEERRSILSEEASLAEDFVLL